MRKEGVLYEAEQGTMDRIIRVAQAVAVGILFLRGVERAVREDDPGGSIFP
jgi:hypothetical protein